VLICAAFITAPCQKVLIIEKPGNRVSYKFYEGNYIRLKLIGDSTVIEGKINSIRDSTILVGYNYEFRTSQIDMLYKARWGFTLLSSALIMGGTAYFAIDVVNNVINGDKPVVRTGTAIASGSMLTAGFITSLFRYRKCPVAKKNWRVKILDLSSNKNTP
jgi:hypothetical protein